MSFTPSRTTCLLVSFLITSSSLTQAAPFPIESKYPSRIYVLVTPRSNVESLSNTAENGSVTPSAAASSDSSPAAPDAEASKGSNAGAIVGGTVATGVILVILVFVLFAIRRQLLIRKELKRKNARKSKVSTEETSSSGTVSQKKEPVKKTTGVPSLPPLPHPLPLAPLSLPPGSRSLTPVPPSSTPIPPSSHRPPPIQTQPDKDKDLDSRSSYSSTSSTPSTPGSANSTKAQVGRCDWASPNVPSKAAHFLGLNEREVLQSRVSNQPSAAPTSPSPASFDLPLQGAAPQRRSSGCTMSTLGMELLRDVMQSPDIERFNTPPIAGGPWQPSHSRQSSHQQVPAQDRLPSQVCFLPEFSPTSPAPNQGPFQNLGPARRSVDVPRPERVVKRDTERRDRFSMGSNKF